MILDLDTEQTCEPKESMVLPNRYFIEDLCHFSCEALRYIQSIVKDTFHYKYFY